MSLKRAADKVASQLHLEDVTAEENDALPTSLSESERKNYLTVCFTAALCNCNLGIASCACSDRAMRRQGIWCCTSGGKMFRDTCHRQKLSAMKLYRSL
jgi:hypothetical protein